MPSPNDYASVRNVLENYIKGSYTADTDLLKHCFHSDALMSGYYRGALEIGSPQPFFDQLESEPSSKSSSEDYQAELALSILLGAWRVPVWSKTICLVRIMSIISICLKLMTSGASSAKSTLRFSS